VSRVPSRLYGPLRGPRASRRQMKITNRTITNASTRNHSSRWFPVLGILISINNFPLVARS
jgi:hypothetical protein